MGLTKHLIVARYNEDVVWLKNIHCMDSVFLYNKGKELDGAIQLANINREAHTYVYHIISNYDSLADYNFFLQGNPFPHIQNVNKDNLNEALSLISCLGHAPLFNTFLTDWTGLSLACFKDCLQGSPENIQFSPGAQWVVTKESIQSKSKQFYERLFENLKVNRTCNRDGLYNAWNLEGLWNYIFDKNIKEKGYAD